MFRQMSPLLAACCVVALGCASPPAIPEEAPPAAKEPAADRIYLGTIVTVDSVGRIAEAVAVKDGRILLVGDEGDVFEHRGRETEVVDLGGAVLLPGFIDPHSHIASHGIAITGWANVSLPPVGSVESIPDIVTKLEELKQASGAAPGDWLVAYGYDKDGLAEGREVTRDDLDPPFPDNPVLMIHVSSHGAVLNSKAFEMVGISAKTPTPPGGIIARKPGSREPAGLLMEMPFFMAVQQLPQPSVDQKLAALAPAQQNYAANGYTTVQDGATSAEDLALLERAADEGRLYLDVVALPNWQAFPALLKTPGVQWGGPYRGHLKLGGVKTVIDGSPQGRTAFFIEPMLVRGPGGQKNWRGEPILSQADVDEIFRQANAHGVQTYTHANADAAIDMFLSAWESIGAPEGRRPVVIHSQFVRPEQLAAYARIGAVPSFFTNHAFFWGDVHVENLGEPRAFFLSPLRSASERGIRFTNHSDFAVTPLDPMFMLWTATERVSRSGVVIGPEERVSIAEALRALTIDAAYQYFEEETKGSIEAGKLADFVILDRNPLDAPGDELRDIRVLETIKEGETVWSAADGEEPIDAE
jgi:predicted amidohydrolase YtcJ